MTNDLPISLKKFYARSDNLTDEIKRRFRRSANLNVPFVLNEFRPKEDEKQQMMEESVSLITLLIKTTRTPVMIANIMNFVPESGILKHIESRDHKSGEANIMEILLEIELMKRELREMIIENLRSICLEVQEIGVTSIPLVPSEAMKYNESGFE
ncbi:unnamed protein product, partial [Dracunculus medinensis]|uniref:Resolvase n=1 Tax=Dracunculus medinensis TaxID=318479 RepID=A0A0N4UR57_DRAME